MPWDAGDAHKHSKSANPEDWAKIANAIRRKLHGKPNADASAIRIANAKASKRS